MAKTIENMILHSSKKDFVSFAESLEECVNEKFEKSVNKKIKFYKENLFNEAVMGNKDEEEDEDVEEADNKEYTGLKKKKSKKVTECISIYEEDGELVIEADEDGDFYLVENEDGNMIVVEKDENGDLVITEDEDGNMIIVDTVKMAASLVKREKK